MATETIPEHTGKRWEHQDGRKFYTARMSSDMLGWWAVTCEWGSLHSRLGNRRVYAYRTYAEALRHMEGLSKRRKKRGYMSGRDVFGNDHDS